MEDEAAAAVVESRVVGEGEAKGGEVQDEMEEEEDGDGEEEEDVAIGNYSGIHRLPTVECQRIHKEGGLQEAFPKVDRLDLHFIAI